MNTAPQITEGGTASVTMDEDSSPAPFSLTLNAADTDGDTLTWSISAAAGHGTATASGTGTSKAIGYVPAANYNGADSFVVLPVKQTTLMKNPNSKISRQDMMVMIARALKISEKLTVTEDTQNLNGFSDKEDIAAYAVYAVNALVKEGLVKGSGKFINPNSFTTRAEAAVLINKIYNRG